MPWCPQGQENALLWRCLCILNEFGILTKTISKFSNSNFWNKYLRLETFLENYSCLGWFTFRFKMWVIYSSSKLQTLRYPVISGECYVEDQQKDRCSCLPTMMLVWTWKMSSNIASDLVIENFQRCIMSLCSARMFCEQWVLLSYHCMVVQGCPVPACSRCDEAKPGLGLQLTPSTAETLGTSPDHPPWREMK